VLDGMVGGGGGRVQITLAARPGSIARQMLQPFAAGPDTVFHIQSVLTSHL
jgi:hypothetical protein